MLPLKAEQQVKIQSALCSKDRFGLQIKSLICYFECSDYKTQLMSVVLFVSWRQFVSQTLNLLTGASLRSHVRESDAINQASIGVNKQCDSKINATITTIKRGLSQTNLAIE